MEQIITQKAKNCKPVDRALSERRRRGCRKIAGRNWNFYDSSVHIDDLSQNFLVEDKAVGIHFKVHGLEDLAAEGAVAGMVFGELKVKGAVFEHRKKSVGHEFPPGHSLRDRIGAEETRAQHHVGGAVQ